MAMGDLARAKHPLFRWRQFGSDLRRKRRKLGYGQRETARTLKIHAATWCRAEHGKPLTVPIYLKICAWMEVDPFFYRSGQQTTGQGE
jgi:transcriptional regulator with XRE-family HTH domain